eukprot:756631-Hanusia_phi.AAC.6
MQNDPVGVGPLAVLYKTRLVRKIVRVAVLLTCILFVAFEACLFDLTASCKLLHTEVFVTLLRQPASLHG